MPSVTEKENKKKEPKKPKHFWVVKESSGYDSDRSKTHFSSKLQAEKYIKRKIKKLKKDYDLSDDDNACWKEKEKNSWVSGENSYCPEYMELYSIEYFTKAEDAK